MFSRIVHAWLIFSTAVVLAAPAQQPAPLYLFENFSSPRSLSRQWRPVGTKVVDGSAVLTGEAGIQLPGDWSGDVLLVRFRTQMHQVGISYGRGDQRMVFLLHPYKATIAGRGVDSSMDSKGHLQEWQWQELLISTGAGVHTFILDRKLLFAVKARGGLNDIRIGGIPLRKEVSQLGSTEIDFLSLRRVAVVDEPLPVAEPELFGADLRELVRGTATRFRVFGSGFTRGTKLAFVSSPRAPGRGRLTTSVVGEGVLEVQVSLPEDTPLGPLSLTLQQEDRSGSRVATGIELMVVNPLPMEALFERPLEPARVPAPDRPVRQQSTPAPSPWPLRILFGLGAAAVGFPGGYLLGRVQGIRRLARRIGDAWERSVTEKLPRRPRRGKWACKVELVADPEEWGLEALEVVLPPADEDSTGETFILDGPEVECLDDVESLVDLLLTSEEDLRVRLQPVVDLLVAKLGTWAAGHVGLADVPLVVRFRSGLKTRFALLHFEGGPGDGEWVERKSWEKPARLTHELPALRMCAAASDDFIMRLRFEVEDLLLGFVRRIRLVPH
jgi:hypothetical protein